MVRGKPLSSPSMLVNREPTASENSLLYGGTLQQEAHTQKSGLIDKGGESPMPTPIL